MGVLRPDRNKVELVNLAKLAGYDRKGENDCQDAIITSGFGADQSISRDLLRLPDLDVLLRLRQNKNVASPPNTRLASLDRYASGEYNTLA